MQSQNMEEGFSLLENGQYPEAVVYFNIMAKDHPYNLTAQICKGRAMGLNGETQVAKKLFAELLFDHPNNFEIQLNYAESLLWNREFDTAKSYYLNLHESHRTHFTVLLGLANTYSNLKDFDNAMKYIGMALVQDPLNQGALSSLKYIRLGMAQTATQNAAFEKANRLWADNLIDFPNDTETLWAFGQGLLIQKRWNEAKEQYAGIEDPVQSEMGLALVAYHTKKYREALLHARKAKDAGYRTKQEFKSASLFISALLWNSKFKQAKAAIESLSQKFSGKIEIANLWAQYGMYTGNFQLSVTKFEKLLEAHPDSFDGLLGMANAQWALGNYEEASQFAQKALQFYPGQGDALTLLNKVAEAKAPKTKGQSTYGYDNGNNESLTHSINATLPLHSRLSFSLNYSRKINTNRVNDTEALLQTQSISVQYRLNNNKRFNASFGLAKNTGNDSVYEEIVGSTSFSMQPSPRELLSVSFRRELQSFNASLLNEQIVMNHYALQHNIVSKKGTGWYMSYMHTQQSDDNTRKLLFTSVYHSIFKSPLLKTGLNYQYLTFSQSRPDLYFSPDKYQATEVFLDGAVRKKKWEGSITLAGGYQWILDQDPTNTFRCEGGITYKIGMQWMVKAIGKYTSIASETASGFNYTELGVQLSWSPKVKGTKSPKAN